MHRDELNALFEMQRQFPGMYKWVDELGVMHIEVVLSADQWSFWNRATEMMAPK
jgi:hypothetical protein